MHKFSSLYDGALRFYDSEEEIQACSRETYEKIQVYERACMHMTPYIKPPTQTPGFSKHTAAIATHSDASVAPADPLIPSLSLSLPIPSH